MAKNRFLAIDIGASKVVVAEFISGKPGELTLLSYGISSMSEAAATGGANTSAYIVSAIRDLMREHAIKPAPMLMSISGQSVFPRFVKLPPVAPDKVAQMVRYEAEQNVPFPIEEVVWDYQLIPGNEGELNVMLVAVKVENVQGLTDCVLAAGMEPEIVDAAPMALYNTVRYNYPSLEGCTMVLDIGAKSSNLIFVEESRIFSRSIPVAGNNVTQEIAKELGISFDEAETTKKEHGFVAFGGVYGGPDSELADKVSKIVRNVITRLHAEVNRSINFYRSQQGGNAPQLVLLTGGSSMIPHTDTFFRERLKVDVEYLNPFANVPVGERVDPEQLGADAGRMGEVVGLALRKALRCPVEINLMPPRLVAVKVFRKRQPFFALAAVGVILVVLCWWAFTLKVTSVQDSRIRDVGAKSSKLQSTQAVLAKAVESRKNSERVGSQVLAVVGARARWVEILDAIHGAMLEGMWLTALEPVKANEQVTGVRISGRGFDDALRAKDEPNKTAIEVFRDRLRESPVFVSNKVAITYQPPITAQEYAREFTIEAGLSEPVATRRDG